MASPPISASSSHGTSKPQAVNLPRLTTLTIRDSAAKSCFFLEAIRCQLEKLCVAAYDDHADYDNYADVYLHLLQVCRQQMAPVLAQNPLTFVRIKRTFCGFRMKGYRWEQDLPANSLPSEDDMQMHVEFAQGRPGDASMVTEELVVHAINVVPRRETIAVWLKLEDMDELDLFLLAQYLRELPGIQCHTIRIRGYQEEWWVGLTKGYKETESFLS